MSDYIQLARIRGHIALDYIQIAAIRGTPNRSNNPIPMVLNDFYTLCLKNPKENIGLRKKAKPELPVFKTTDTSVEYLCSDFVRFCLALYKTNGHIDADNMSLVPVIPFPISKELKEYMREFLPDFYGIRK